jgi:hypothetical protein
MYLAVPTDPVTKLPYPLMGAELVTDGLPALSVSWYSSNKRTRMERPMHELTFASNSPKKSSVMVGRNEEGGTSKSASLFAPATVSPNIARSVTNYLIAEMYLGAEMCMDRNYVAMHKLDPLFPYETLISIIKADFVDNKVKAAAVRLVMCLYVDRDPQASSKIKKNPEPQLPFVPPQRRYNFGLVQQMVADHVDGMAGTRWDELSKQMLLIMGMMVKFNFYGSTDRMRNVIGPILKALDRRNILVVDSSKDSPSSKDSKKTQSGEPDLSEKAAAALAAGLQDELNMAWSVPGLKPQDSFKSSSFSFMKAASFTSIGSGSGDDELESLASSADDEGTGLLQRRRKGRRNREFFVVPIMTELFSSFNFIAAVAMLACATFVLAVLDVVDLDLVDGSAWRTILLVLVALLTGESVARVVLSVAVQGRGYFTSAENRLTLGLDGLDLVVSVLILLSLFVDFVEYFSLGIILRLARVLSLVLFTKDAAVSDSAEESKPDAYVQPRRYSKAPGYELQTMVGAVNVLAFAQKVIEDRNLSLVLRYFSAYEAGNDKRTPAELFEQAFTDSQALSLGVEDFDQIMIDLLMFVHPPLVQGCIEVLMAHHSKRRSLLTHATEVQLLASTKRERQFKIVDQMLQQLEQNAETQELWGELVTEADRATSKQTMDILHELTDICRVRRLVLEFDEEYSADVEIQNLYRNLGCFDISLKVPAF